MKSKSTVIKVDSTKDIKEGQYIIVNGTQAVVLKVYKNKFKVIPALFHKNWINT